MATRVDYFAYDEENGDEVAALSPITSPNAQDGTKIQTLTRRQTSVEHHDDFSSKYSQQVRRRHSDVNEKERWVGINLTPMYFGVGVIHVEPALQIGLCIHDGTYSIDFSIEHLTADRDVPKAEISQIVEDYVFDQITKFSKEHLVKFVGAGLTHGAEYYAPNICGKLWSDFDVVPFVFDVRQTYAEQLVDGSNGGGPTLHKLHSASYVQTRTADKVTTYIPPRIKLEDIRPVDEQADSAARKALMHFGPNHNPRLSIGFRNQVEVDTNFRVHLISDLKVYESTVRDTTWRCVLKYADILKTKRVKIAFFNSTPQGGGVALMRHALMRFYHLLGVDAKWYVPQPNPQVFRTTKNNHNILQGVQDSSTTFSDNAKEQFTMWIENNAKRYWMSPGGPLAPGGADVVIIDDPQMPGLIPMIKKARPDVPIIYRSHIEIRGDLATKPGSLQAKVWDYLWERIQYADVFLSHPVNSFVPSTVPLEKVGLMGAATDWLDGLSKKLRDWDLRYYFHNFRTLCGETRMYKLAYPARDYIVQVARFDPSKGIPTVIESYVKLRKKLDDILPNSKTPQLLICGHGAVDDPDASIIYDQVISILDRDENQRYAPDIVVMRIPPSDQLLNALLSCAKVGLQLSSREGFEVKVSECLHKGIPIIATRAGGIPLQVQHEKNGFLVDVGDSSAAANYLYDLWTDAKLYKRMSDYAKISVSDEVGTVGNALLFMYLAAKLAGTQPGDRLKPNGRWVNDMMREDAGEPYQDGENRLPRGGIHAQS